MYIIYIRDENCKIVEVIVLGQLAYEFEQLFQVQELEHVCLDALFEKTDKGYVLVKYNI
ncbi:hypothetical protein [Bacillus toyonensis]|uniref:hypothetical protein n=1 Tax=Bacillus toyonensis TaxID=155322 RepID=UPI0015968D8C|nr:hypothetical protein [Bacillus toyonensis]